MNLINHNKRKYMSKVYTGVGKAEELKSTDCYSRVPVLTPSTHMEAHFHF